MTSYPSFASIAAQTELSTPPLIATTTRVSASDLENPSEFFDIFSDSAIEFKKKK